MASGSKPRVRAMTAKLVWALFCACSQPSPYFTLLSTLPYTPKTSTPSRSSNPPSLVHPSSQHGHLGIVTPRFMSFESLSLLDLLKDTPLKTALSHGC